MVIALAGRRIDAPETAPARFPAAAVADVARRLRAVLLESGATAIVSSAACGADLVALREARTLGLRRRIILPFDRERFRRTSVVDRGSDWGALFDTLVADAEIAGDLVTLGVDDESAGFRMANTAILDEAEAMAAGTAGEALAIVVWEGGAHGDDDFTDAFAREARKRGLRVRDVSTAGKTG